MATRNRIFISYDFENDRNYRNLLTAWDQNDLFDFEFYDASLKVAVNSDDAAYVRSVIKPKIQRSTHLLCLVGEETHKSEWVAWEIDKAIEAGKKLVAVKLKSTNATPPKLLGAGATWAMSFTFASIKTAVESA